MGFDVARVEQMARAMAPGWAELAPGFAQICRFLSEQPYSLSWRSAIKPDLSTEAGLAALARKYFAGRQASAFPGSRARFPTASLAK